MELGHLEVRRAQLHEPPSHRLLTEPLAMEDPAAVTSEEHCSPIPSPAPHEQQGGEIRVDQYSGLQESKGDRASTFACARNASLFLRRVDKTKRAGMGNATCD